MQELLNILNTAKSTLDNYYEIHRFLRKNIVSFN